MTTVQTFNNWESWNSIRSKINTSLTNLNNDKAENSTVEALETNLESQINTKVTNVYWWSNVSVNRVGNDVYVSSTGGGWWSGNDSSFAYYSTTATQGQTIFNIGFTYTNWNNNLFVFANWLKMQVWNDYTESSSTSITFNYGLNAGDIVQVIYPNKWLNWKNTYDNLTSYVKDDAVGYNGSSYICIADTTWNLPTNTTYWGILASKWDKWDNWDVIWPNTSTNNSVVRFDWITWKVIQESWAYIDDNWDITANNLSWINTWDQKDFNSWIVNLPTITNNLNGSITIWTDWIINFYTVADWDSIPVRKNMITWITIILTDNTVNYIYADYNSWTPIYANTLDVSWLFTDWTKSPVLRVVRYWTKLHIEEYDNPWLALPNKMLFKNIRLSGFQREDWLILSTSWTRISNVSGWTARLWVKKRDISANISWTSWILEEWYLTAWVWNRTTVTSYDSIYYSDWTNRQSLWVAKYVAKYFFRDIWDDNEVYYIHWWQHNSQADALNEALPAVSPLITSHSLYVWKIVIQQWATIGTAYPRDWGIWLQNTTVTDHNNLSNIQWWALWDYQHLTTAQVTNLNNQSWVNTGNQTMSNGTPITATQWQTVCTAPTYVIWSAKLEVYLNWILQEITQDYTETSTTSITFVTWLLAWDRVTYKLLS